MERESCLKPKRKRNNGLLDILIKVCHGNMKSERRIKNENNINLLRQLFQYWSTGTIRRMQIWKRGKIDRLQVQETSLVFFFMGIAISTGSACDSKNTQLSHVIQAIKVPAEYAKGTVRVSFGKYNNEEEAEAIGNAFAKVLK